MTAIGLKSYLVFDFKVVYRERLMLLLILLLPALFYAFFGLIFGDASYGPDQTSFYHEYTPSFTGLILLNVALMNVAPVLAIYKELGFFRRLMVTPLDMSAIWLSAILRSFAIFMIGYAEMLLVGYLQFGMLPEASPLQLVTAIAVSSFALFSFGFLLGALLKSANAVFNAGILVFQPMLLLSGASFPLDIFPSWIRIVTELIPMTHVVKILRLAWRNDYLSPEAVWPTVFLLIFGSICAVVARATFRRSAT